MSVWVQLRRLGHCACSVDDNEDNCYDKILAIRRGFLLLLLICIFVFQISHISIHIVRQFFTSSDVHSRTLACTHTHAHAQLRKKALRTMWMPHGKVFHGNTIVSAARGVPAGLFAFFYPVSRWRWVGGGG